MATYVVGDIQACLTGLLRLLDKVNFCPQVDKLVAVGDLIGRGSQAPETLEFLTSLGESFDTVLGNHDLHFLAICANVRQAKAGDKYQKLLASPLLEHYITWLRHKPLVLKLSKQIIVSHAGLYPLWSCKQALSLSQEVSKLLQSDHWQSLVANMYGSQPNDWSEDLTGYDRIRFIINACTRMRYLQHQHTLDFGCKTAPKDAPKNLAPWYQVSNSLLKKDHRVLFGHWAALHGKTNSKHFIGLDTGYIWGQSMTLINIDTMTKTSVKYQEN